MVGGDLVLPVPTHHNLSPPTTTCLGHQLAAQRGAGRLGALTGAAVAGAGGCLGQGVAAWARCGCLGQEVVGGDLVLPVSTHHNLSPRTTTCLGHQLPPSEGPA